MSVTTTDRLVRFAEAMGYELETDPTKKYPRKGKCVLFERTLIVAGTLEKRGTRELNPLTNPADAIELAVKMKCAYEYRPRAKGDKYWAWMDPIEHGADDLCTAICAAVEAALEAK